MFSVKSSPHQRVKRDTGNVMQLVVLCLIPGIIVQSVLFGFGLVIQLVLAVVTAIVAEVIFLEWRKKNFERATKTFVVDSLYMTGRKNTSKIFFNLVVQPRKTIYGIKVT